MQYGSSAFAARPGEVWGNRDKAQTVEWQYFGLRDWLHTVTVV